MGEASSGGRDGGPGAVSGGLRALVVDWGGVLTAAMDESTAAWTAADGIDETAMAATLREWADDGPAVRGGAGNPVHALERGELARADFEGLLAARLRGRDGGPIGPEGLIARMFAHCDGVPGMLAVVRRLRDAGIRTALLSNSWGHEYPRDGWDAAFDAVVISGEVGMRKPEPRIFHHTLDLLACAPHETVFVDDAAVNVRAAVALGFVGVVHRCYEQSVLELEALFGIGLSV